MFRRYLNQLSLHYNMVPRMFQFVLKAKLKSVAFSNTQSTYRVTSIFGYRKNILIAVERSIADPNI